MGVSLDLAGVRNSALTAFPYALPLPAIGVAFALMSVSIVAWPRSAVIASSLIGGILLIGLAAVERIQNPINAKLAAAQAGIGLWIAIASTVALLRGVRHRGR